jgi:very-short-patch-repair endonuclease
VPANFQGDQRDVIFLSLVVAPNHPYRALTNLQEQRRFNVAMSRARDQVWLFHSVQQHDLSREDLRWRLLNFLYSADAGVLEGLYEESDRLEREAKRLYREPGNQPEPYESWFELDVALELLRRKYHVRPQYNVAGYRIDLVVEGTENRLAVECDGDAWHGPDKYDQDMTRQRQLERASWTFVRIRESEFYANRGRAVEQVVEECHRLGIQPVTHYDAGPLQESARETNATLVGTMISDDDVPGQRPAADVESAALLENDSARESGPFTGYSSECGFPDPREASPTNVRATLGQIIEKDGPLTRESVFRLYVEGCADLHRVGKIVRQALNRALGAMLRSGEIVQEDELGDGSPEGLVVRLADTPKVRERSTGRRDLLEIPPSELFLALDRICASFTGIMQDDKTLARALLDHYAFTRLTEVRRKHLTRILSVHHRQRQ